MPSQKNQELLNEIKSCLSRCTIAITTNYNGMSVPAVNELRRRLREQGVEYKVVKKTLTILAGVATGKEGIGQILEGPIAIIFGYGNPVTPAKVLDEYIRATRSPLTVRGALMDDKVLQVDEVFRLANLPSPEESVARLIGQLQSPLVRLVTVLGAPLQGLATVLQRQIEQLEVRTSG